MKFIKINEDMYINATEIQGFAILKRVEHVEIKEHDEGGKTFFYVDISTRDGGNYSSEYFDTFEKAERYVKDLIDKLN